MSGNISGKGNAPGNYNSFDQQDFNTYGLSPSFLASLNIVGPLHTKVFVANVSIIAVLKFYLFFFYIFSLFSFFL